jgi:hypothetical protein
MRRSNFKLVNAALAALLVAGPLGSTAAAQGQGQGQGQKQGQGQGQGSDQARGVTEQAQERVYGWELMTDKERQEHQAKMRSLKTEQERQAFQAEHNKKMQERAKAQGKTLPDMSSTGRGPGHGQGQGQMQAGPADSASQQAKDREQMRDQARDQDQARERRDDSQVKSEGEKPRKRWWWPFGDE